MKPGPASSNWPVRYKHLAGSHDDGDTTYSACLLSACGVLKLIEQSDIPVLATSQIVGELSEQICRGELSGQIWRIVGAKCALPRQLSSPRYHIAVCVAI